MPRRLLALIALLISPTVVASCGSDSEPAGIYVADVMGDGAVSVIDPESGDIRVVEFQDSDAGDRSFAWSPDGQWVAYRNFCCSGGRSELWTMDSDGSNRHQLTFDESPGSFSWLSDGRRIVYGTPLGSSEYRVAVVDDGGVRLFFDREGMLGGLTVSPNGQLVVFNVKGEGRQVGDLWLGGNEIWTANVDGSNERLLVADVEGANGAGIQLSWSPNGEYIAFVRSLEADQPHWKSDIFLVRTDGTGLRQLTKRLGDHTSPTWSPDNKRIAFNYTTGFEDTDMQVWIMNADGTDKRFLGQYGWLTTWR